MRVDPDAGMGIFLVFHELDSQLAVIDVAPHAYDPADTCFLGPRDDVVRIAGTGLGPYVPSGCLAGGSPRRLDMAMGVDQLQLGHVVRHPVLLRPRPRRYQTSGR